MFSEFCNFPRRMRIAIFPRNPVRTHYTAWSSLFVERWAAYDVIIPRTSGWSVVRDIIAVGGVVNSRLRS